MVKREMKGSKEQLIDLQEQEAKKPTISGILERVVNSVKSGNLNPLDAHLFLKSAEKNFTNAKAEIEELAILEAKKYGKTFDYKGVEITVSEGRASYDFSNIQEISELEKKLKALKEIYKKVYLSRQKGIISVVEDGEILKSPTVKYGKSFLSVK